MKLEWTRHYEAEFDLEGAMECFKDDYELYPHTDVDELLTGIVENYLTIPYDCDDRDTPFDMAFDMLKRNVSIQLSMFDDMEDE